jgi:hypothetical protein
MDGILRRDGERVAVRFERVLDAPQAEVWAALTDPALRLRPDYEAQAAALP